MSEHDEDPSLYSNLVDDHLINQMEPREVAPANGAHASVLVPLAPKVSNHVGGLQGGLMATLVDLAAGRAVRHHLGEEAVFVTTDLNIHYLSVISVGPARADATMRRSGRSLVLTVEVIDVGADETLGAVATIAFRVIS